jgi:branched-chain amino acid transport system substrate-binding protein
MFRERVAVAFITLSIAASLGLGYYVVQDYNSRGTTQTAAANDTTPPDTTTADASPTAAADPGAQATNQPGSSTTTVVGGGQVTGGAKSAPKTIANTQAGSGVSGDKILVGGFFDMTGPVDSSVERDTVRAYFAKVNAAGGINGRQLVFVDCDSQYDAVQTHSCSNEMVADKVLALVGVTAPKGENEEVSFITQKQGIPWIGGLGTPEEYKYALAYPVSPSFSFSGNGLAGEFVADQKSLPYGSGSQFKHPAIVYINDVSWIQPVLQAILDALHKVGVTETHVEGAGATNPDYSGQVANLEQQGDGPGGCPSNHAGPCPDSLIAALDPFSYARLFQAMDRVGWHPPVIGGGLDKGNQQSAYADQLLKAQSLVPFLSPLDPANANNPTIKDYYGSVKRYYQNQFSALDVYTQISWTAAMVFVDAANRAGKDLTRATLVDALNNTKNFDTGWSTKITYSAGNGHDPNHCYWFVQHDAQTADQGGTWRTTSPLTCF